MILCRDDVCGRILARLTLDREESAVADLFKRCKVGLEVDVSFSERNLAEELDALDLLGLGVIP